MGLLMETRREAEGFKGGGEDVGEGVQIGV